MQRYLVSVVAAVLGMTMLLGSLAAAAPKQRKLAEPQERLLSSFGQSYTKAFIYDTPQGKNFQITERSNGSGRSFSVTTPRGTQFAEEKFWGDDWAGFVARGEGMFFATDKQVYRYQAQPEELFEAVYRPPRIRGKPSKIGASLDEYFLLFSGGATSYGHFLGVLDLRTGEDGEVAWQLIPYQGSRQLTCLRTLTVDNSRHELHFHFVKPDEPGVIRPDTEEEERIIVAFDVTNEIFLPDSEDSVAVTPDP